MTRHSVDEQLGSGPELFGIREPSASMGSHAEHDAACGCGHDHSDQTNVPSGAAQRLFEEFLLDRIAAHGGTDPDAALRLLTAYLEEPHPTNATRHYVDEALGGAHSEEAADSPMTVLLLLLRDDDGDTDAVEPAAL